MHTNSYSAWHTRIRTTSGSPRFEPPEQPERLAPGEQLVLRDLSICEPRTAWSEKPRPGRWQLRGYRLPDGTSGHALGVDERVKPGEGPRALPPEVTIDPRLKGWYAVFVSLHRPMYHGGIDVRLSSRPWTFINPQERESVRPDPAKPRVVPVGENDVEIEVLYTVAPVDGEQIHLRFPGGRREITYPVERGRASVTGLRFVALDAAVVEAYQADLADPATKRVIINFESYGGHEFLPSWLDAYAVSDVGAIHMEFGAGSAGLLYPDSAYDDVWGANIPDAVLPSLKPFYRFCLADWRAVLAEGKTLFDIAVPLARQAGIRVMGSLRMDIFWGDGSDNPADWRQESLDDYPLMFNGRFYREHPELRIPGSPNLDYFQPAVREHFAGLLAEAAERLDVDGINMDFTRWPPFIRQEADPQIMVEFLADVRRRLDEVGARKGKRLALSAELVDGQYVEMTLTQQQVDFEAWLRSGCLDYVAVEVLDHPHFKVKPERPLEHYLEVGRRAGVPVYVRQDQTFVFTDEPCASGGFSFKFDNDPYFGDELIEEEGAKQQPYCGPQHYERGVLEYYRSGAVGVLLSNRCQGWLGLRRLGHEDELAERSRTGEVFGVRVGEPIAWTQQ